MNGVKVKEEIRIWKFLPSFLSLLSSLCSLILIPEAVDVRCEKI